MTPEERKAFKERMKQLKAYRELNPGKGYWDFKQLLAPGPYSAGELVKSIGEFTKHEEYLGPPSHNYDFTLSEEWADKHGYYPDERGHRDDIVKKEAHPTHPSKGKWVSRYQFDLTDKGMEDPNFVLYGLNDGGLDPQATMTYKGGIVLPEFTVTPKGNYIYNSYDNIKAYLPGGEIGEDDKAYRDSVRAAEFNRQIVEEEERWRKFEELCRKAEQHRRSVEPPKHRQCTQEEIARDSVRAARIQHDIDLVMDAMRASAKPIGPTKEALEKTAANLVEERKDKFYPYKLGLKSTYEAVKLLLAGGGMANGIKLLQGKPAISWGNSSELAGEVIDGIECTAGLARSKWDDVAENAALLTIGELGRKNYEPYRVVDHSTGADITPWASKARYKGLIGLGILGNAYQIFDSGKLILGYLSGGEIGDDDIELNRDAYLKRLLDSPQKPLRSPVNNTEWVMKFGNWLNNRRQVLRLNMMDTDWNNHTRYSFSQPLPAFPIYPTKDAVGDEVNRQIDNIETAKFYPNDNDQPLLQTGYYNTKDHSVHVWSKKPGDDDWNRMMDDVTNHEFAHAAGYNSPQVEKIRQHFSDKISDKYLDDADEIYARLMQLRFNNKIDPNEVWTKEKLQKLIQDNKTELELYKQKESEIRQKYSRKLEKYIRSNKELMSNKNVQRGLSGNAAEYIEKVFQYSKDDNPFFKEMWDELTPVINKKYEILDRDPDILTRYSTEDILFLLNDIAYNDMQLTDASIPTARYGGVIGDWQYTPDNIPVKSESDTPKKKQTGGYITADKINLIAHTDEDGYYNPYYDRFTDTYGPVMLPLVNVTEPLTWKASRIAAGRIGANAVREGMGTAFKVAAPIVAGAALPAMASTGGLGIATDIASIATDPLNPLNYTGLYYSRPTLAVQDAINNMRKVAMINAEKKAQYANELYRIIERMMTDDSYLNRAAEVYKQFGDDYSIPYADTFMAYNISPESLPKVELFDNLSLYGYMQRLPDGKYIYGRNVSLTQPNNAEHELSHFTDLMKSGTTNAEDGNKMFAEMSKDLTKEVDRHDRYFMDPSELKAHMNLLREWMYDNGFINTRGEKVPANKLKRALNYAGKIGGLEGVERASKQFKDMKTYAKWFNTIPLISTIPPIVNQEE